MEAADGSQAQMRGLGTEGEHEHKGTEENKPHFKVAHTGRKVESRWVDTD